MGHSGIFYYDDGTRGYEDAAGNIVLMDNRGTSLPAPSSGIGQQVFNLLDYGVRTVLDARYRPQNRAAAAQAQANGTRQMMGLALLGLGAFVLYKLLT